MSVRIVVSGEEVQELVDKFGLTEREAEDIVMAQDEIERSRLRQKAREWLAVKRNPNPPRTEFIPLR